MGPVIQNKARQCQNLTANQLTELHKQSFLCDGLVLISIFRNICTYVLRLRDHLQKDRSQKTAHICYTLIDKRLIDKSVDNRFTIYQVDPQREPAPKTEHHRTTLGRRHCSARSSRIWRLYKKLFCQSDRNQMRKNWRQWDALPWR